MNTSELRKEFEARFHPPIDVKWDEKNQCYLCKTASPYLALWMGWKAAREAECCKVTPEEQELLNSGEYMPEELFGIGGKPSCPKCYTVVDMTSAAAEGYRDAVEHTVQICKLGDYGSAFDGPEVTRAYTYQHQPHNSVAFRLGQACYLAMENRGGDSIDLGLSLLQQLERVELGVFEVKP